MARLLLSTSAYRRVFGNLPQLLLTNFFVEATPTAETGIVLQSRKGLTSHTTPGSTGPVNGIFTQKGVFSNALFSIPLNTLCKDATSLGSVTGSGPSSWAASDTELVVTRGSSAYSYNGSNLAVISLPDSFSAKAVAYIAGLFVFIRSDSHKFYWSNPLDGRTVESLDFASAELGPDKLLDVKAIRGVLYLFGESTTEAWFPSGNVDLPFTRIDQRLFSKGVLFTGCVAEVNDSLVMVGHDGTVYQIADVPNPISNPGIDEQIRASTTCRAFSFSYEGHHFFCVRLDDTTLVWDATTGEWSDFTTYGLGNWRAWYATNIGPTPYFADDDDNIIWKFGTTFKDASAQLEGYFTAVIPISGGTLPIDNLRIDMNTGHTEPLSGDDATPVMEMRASRDRGNSFTDWREASIGAQGEFRTRAMWRRLGMFDPPGAVFEFRVTDQSPRAITGAYINEAGGGLSR